MQFTELKFRVQNLLQNGTEFIDSYLQVFLFGRFYRGTSIAFQVWRCARMENFIWRGPCQDAGYKYRFAGLRLYRQYIAVACSRLTRYFKACYAPLSLSHRRRTSLKEGRNAAGEKRASLHWRRTHTWRKASERSLSRLTLPYIRDHRESV